MSDDNGLRFGEFGVIFSAQPVPPSSANGRSLEIWMQPAKAKDSNTILAFYDHGAPRRLSLLQSESDLKLQIAPTSAWVPQRTSSIYVGGVFRDRKSIFWTVTSGPSGTSVYRDGVLVRASGGWRIASEEFSGLLVLGTSPISNEDWSGILRGVAIYDRSLSPSQTLRHYQTWTVASRPKIEPADSCIALYLLDEHTGRIIHNRLSLSTDLIIPVKYMILNQTVLDPIWRAFKWSWGFWQDAIINVIGFIPPCFFFCAYLSTRKLRRPTLVASLAGTCISLLIELLQSKLPTRDSSMSDLINNTIGSAIGATLYRGTLVIQFNRFLDRSTQLLTGR